MAKHGMVNKQKSEKGIGLGIARSFGGIADVLDKAKQTGVYA